MQRKLLALVQIIFFIKSIVKNSRVGEFQANYFLKGKSKFIVTRHKILDYYCPDNTNVKNCERKT